MRHYAELQTVTMRHYAELQTVTMRYYTELQAIALRENAEYDILEAAHPFGEKSETNKTLYIPSMIKMYLRTILSTKGDTINFAETTSEGINSRTTKTFVSE